MVALIDPVNTGVVQCLGCTHTWQGPQVGLPDGCAPQGGPLGGGSTPPSMVQRGGQGQGGCWACQGEGRGWRVGWGGCRRLCSGCYIISAYQNIGSHRPACRRYRQLHQCHTTDGDFLSPPCSSSSLHQPLSTLKSIHPWLNYVRQA